MQNRFPNLKNTGIAVLLFSFNAYICQKLFFTEYSNQMASVEGALIAIVRQATEHLTNQHWWPLWFCGMPYQNVYGPLFHHFAAVLALALRISPALAFHAAAALVYCLGPVTLFWMVYRFSNSRLCGFWAGLLYSTLSPEALLIPAVRAEISGAFHLRRLFNIYVWAEQPHIAALMLAPLVLLALDAALRTRKLSRHALAAVMLAALTLTNVTGSVGFTMILAAYLLAWWPQPVLHLAAIATLAYGLAAPWLPPSTLRLIASNSQWSLGGHYPFTMWHALYFAGLIAVAAALWFLFKKLRVAEFLRFALFLTYLSAAIVVPYFWLNFAAVPQPIRFQLEFEMGCFLMLAFVISRLGRTPAIIVATLCLAAAVHNRRYADQLIQSVDVHRTAEYKESMWFGEHMAGRRVFAPGSVSFWLNVFTNTPQLGGCCDQGVPHWQQRVALYTIYSGKNAGNRDAEISRIWLQAYGVHAIGVSGPGAGEAYKPFANPQKFDGVLKELWRDGGDVIYEVPQRSASLAHVIPASQVIPRAPVHGLDVEPLRPFVAALNDPALPLADAQWKSPVEAHITTHLSPGQLVSVQVSYHPGWHALVNGSERRIVSDPIGLMVIHPECTGACSIDLIYDGGLEMKLARVAQLLSVVICIALCVLPAVMKRRSSSAER